MRYSLFVSSIALLMTSGSALAADPVLSLPPEPPAATDAPFNWEGPYLGVHVGYARGGENDNQSQYFPDPYYVPTCIPGPIFADHFDVKGLLGGVHAGKIWQTGSLVYGVEADLDYTNLKGDAYFEGAKWLGDQNRQAYGNLAFKSDIQASLRARAGYAVDTWLFYATGGAALARGKFTASGDYKGSEPDSRYIPLTTSDSQTHIGWTVGAGIEKAFAPNLIGRLEARYTDFGSKSYNLGNFGEDVKADWHQATVSVGLSYKF